MKKIINLSLIILSLLAFGCGGKKKGKTSTKVTLGTALSGNLALVGGGVMLFGVNHDNGQRFAQKYTDQVLDLDNGRWSFMAMAWETAPFISNLRCGKSLGEIELKGGEINVPMTLSMPNCQDDFFGSPDTKDASGVPHTLDIASCGNDRCLFNDGGGTDPEDYALRGVGRSYRVIYPGFSLDGTPRNDLGIVSNCTTNHTADSPEHSTILRLPIINFPIPVVVRAFDGTNCTNDFDEYIFPNGIREQQPMRTWFNTVNPAAGPNELRLMSDLCRNDTTIGNYRFSTATDVIGTKKTHVICTQNQFLNMVGAMASAANQDDIYVLARSLDFSGYSPTGIIGDNTNLFKGIFDGQGNTISNYDLDLSAHSQVDNLGIFGKVGGTNSADQAIIMNLNLTDSSLLINKSSVATAGLLVGKVVDDSRVKRISISNSYIDLTDCSSACYEIGLLSGKFESGGGKIESYGNTISNVHISIANSTSNIIGGVLGSMTNNTSLRETVASSIYITGNNLNSIGGIVGQMMGGELYDVSSSVDFQESISFDGSPYSTTLNANGRVGGIVGSVNGSNARIHYAKAEGTISYSTSNPAKIGGVIGEIQTGNMFENIISNLSSLSSTGSSIGGVIGDITVSASNILTKNLRNLSNINCSGDCGGIVGKFNGTSGSYIDLFNSHNYGNVTSTGLYAGGIVGNIISDTNSTQIVKSHNQGTISSNANSATIGGLVGMRTPGSPSNIKILSSYNTGNVSATGTGTKAGGIVGDITSNLADSTTINDVYSIGSISGTSAGFIKGDTFTGSATNCFYDSATNSTANSFTGCLDANGLYNNIVTALSNDFVMNDSGIPTIKEWYKIEKLGVSDLGSRSDPFYITTTAEWNVIGDDPELMNKSFILGNDIDFDSVSFTPIGSLRVPFGGQFRGNNKTIRNVSKDESALGLAEPLGLFRVIGGYARKGACTSSTDDCGGLGCHSQYSCINNSGSWDDTQTEGARIEDHSETASSRSSNKLYLENIHFVGESATGVHVGVLAGIIQDGGSSDWQGVRIENIHVSGGLVEAEGSSTEALGGLAGLVKLKNQSSEFRSLFSSANIQNCSLSPAGGVFGRIDDTGAMGASAVTMDYLHFSGSISCSTTDYLGGIVGLSSYNSIDFENVTNSGTITGEDWVGGIIGSVNGVIFAGKNTGDIYGLSNVGGIAGQTNSKIEASANIDNYLDASSGNAGAITGNCNTCNLLNNLADAISVTATGTASYFSPTVSGGNYNLYTGPADHALGGGFVHIPRDQLFNFTTVSTLSTGLSDSPWIQYPGQRPIFHYEAFPQLFEN